MAPLPPFTKRTLKKSSGPPKAPLPSPPAAHTSFPLPPPIVPSSAPSQAAMTPQCRSARTNCTRLAGRRRRTRCLKRRIATRTWRASLYGPGGIISGSRRRMTRQEVPISVSSTWQDSRRIAFICIRPGGGRRCPWRMSCRIGIGLSGWGWLLRCMSSRRRTRLSCL